MITCCNGRPCSAGLTQSVAPSWRAKSNLAGLMSMAMIRPALAMRAPWITLSPTAPRPKTATVRAGLDPGGVAHGADTGGDAAAEQADLVQWRLLRHPGQRDLRQHAILREGRGAHVVVDHPALERQPAAAIGHHPLALAGADGDAEVRLAGAAELALAALGGVERDDMVAHCHVADAAADGLDDGAALMAENDRKQPFGITARQGVGIGVADAGGDVANQHLAGARFGHVDFDQFERASRGKRDGGTALHCGYPPSSLMINAESCRPDHRRADRPPAGHRWGRHRRG
jgi:hypothetical protein